MTMRRVRTVEEIVFEKADPPVTLPKGAVYMVYEVIDGGIVLLAEDGELIAIDQNTFEAGFEAVG
jgi:hypothetical protein